MKRQLLVIAISIIGIISGCKKDSNTPKDVNEELILKQITGILTPFEFGLSSPSSKFTYSEKKFDENGNVVFSSNRVGLNDLDGDKSYLDGTTYKYDSGKMIEAKESTFRYTYSYAGNDTLEVRRYSSSGLNEIRKYEYSGGKVSTIKNYNYINLDEVFSEENYTYENGKVSKIEIKYEPFLEGNQLLYTYDNKGNMLSEKYFDREDNTTIIQKLFSYKYDELNRISEMVKSHYYTITFRKFINHYDDSGKLIKQDLYEGDEIDGNFEQVATIDFTYEYF